MKTQIYSTIILLTFICLFTNCKEESEPTNQPFNTISGSATSQSECKSYGKSTTFSSTPDSLSKIEYTFYPSQNLLEIKHINTGFNCCPGNINCSIYTIGDTILIEENESEALCDCNCLYDLDIQINDVVSKKYQLKFIEPYAQGLVELSFSIDLSTTTTGEYEVVRKEYPWGIDNE